MENPSISLLDTLTRFQQGEISKPDFIQSMYDLHHCHLFDFASFLTRTNIKKIEIEDDSVIMTSRDRGIRIACNPNDLRIAPIEILNFLDYEIDESRMIDRLAAEGRNFYDIGANIGWYTLQIASHSRDMQVYAFEPIPATFSQLQKNIGLNAFSNINAHNFGFSNKQEELTFYFYPEGSTNASAANLTNGSTVTEVICSVRKFDDYIAQTGDQVDFIKCDVEGGELLVFEGAKATIARDKPVVFAEILRKWSRKFNYEPNEIFAFFTALGYQSFTVDKHTLVPFGLMDETTVETNFFFLHADKHANLIHRYARTQ